MASNEVLIFIVDDEPIIIETLQRALEEAGYTVASASNGDDAFSQIESRSHEFRALITDINLPGELTGWNIAHRARELNPTLPVIYATGASSHEWSARGVPESVLLIKPFALAQVVTAVSQLINATSNLLPLPAPAKLL